MSAAQPYCFDEFGARPASPQTTYSANDLEAARNDAREQAIQSAADADALEQTRLLDLIAERLETAARERNRILDAHLAALTKTARDIVIEFCKSAHTADQSAAALHILERYLAAAPDETPAKLVLSSDAPEGVVERLENAICGREAGAFITVARDDALAPGDARIEWRGGAIDRMKQDAVAEIKSLFANAAPAIKEKRP